VDSIAVGGKSGGLFWSTISSSTTLLLPYVKSSLCACGGKETANLRESAGASSYERCGGFVWTVQSATPKGIVRLDRLRAKPARPHDDPEREHAFSLPAQKKLYVLAASYLEERDEWIEAINRASFFVTGLSST
jgi:hypothetical protein